MKRIQLELIHRDLEKKMVFVVGPRQVGKTWIAKEIGKLYETSIYLNYDNQKDKEVIINMTWNPLADLIVFDEIHKMNGWKNFLKGVYDTKPEKMRILVTGSARLYTHKNVGDSLAGRFFVHTIFPFSLNEIKDQVESTKQPEALDRLINQGGFPEPFLATLNSDSERWRTFYVESLIRADVVDFSAIDNMKSMNEVVKILRHSVGSPVSLSSIGRNVGLSPSTVKKYLSILESLFMIFFVRPHSKRIARAIQKEPKVYFYDTGLVEGDVGVKFENFAAISLLKDVSIRNETTGESNQLSYIRTKDNKEVDFVLVDSENNMKKLIEIKSSNSNISGTLKYFSQKYNLPATQVLKYARNDEYLGDNLQIVDATRFFSHSIFSPQK